jgi:hypothetical protein
MGARADPDGRNTGAPTFASMGVGYVELHGVVAGWKIKAATWKLQSWFLGARRPTGTRLAWPCGAGHLI